MPSQKKTEPSGSFSIVFHLVSFCFISATQSRACFAYETWFIFGLYNVDDFVRQAFIFIQAILPAAVAGLSVHLGIFLG